MLRYWDFFHTDTGHNASQTSRGLDKAGQGLHQGQANASPSSDPEPRGVRNKSAMGFQRVEPLNEQT